MGVIVNRRLDFIESSYTDVLELLGRVERFARIHKAMGGASPSAQHAKETGQISRMVSHLTHALAWLLAQQALRDGDLVEENMGDFNISEKDHKTFKKQSAQENQDMPEDLRTLALEVERLFDRVYALCQMPKPAGFPHRRDQLKELYPVV